MCHVCDEMGLPRYDAVMVLGSEVLHLIPALGDALAKTSQPELEILCGSSDFAITTDATDLDIGAVRRLSHPSRRGSPVCPDCYDLAFARVILGTDRDLTPEDIGMTERADG